MLAPTDIFGNTPVGWGLVRRGIPCCRHRTHRLAATWPNE